MKVFIGCYTKKISEDIIGEGNGIYCFDFDTTKGQLKLLETIPAVNPSYLTISKNSRFLYVIEELDIEESPKIKSFRINNSESDSNLTTINQQDILGSYACHLSLMNSETQVVVACYMTGNLIVYPLGKIGELLLATQNIQHIGNGPNMERQESAHTHMIYPLNSQSLFAVDLGLDVAKAYTFNNLTGNLTETPKMNIEISKGAGARHMAMHPSRNFAFVFSELTAELFSFKRIEDKFTSLEILPSLPADYDKTPSGAAIRIHPNGTFIYVSNRGHNSIGIFQFDIATEKLVLIGHESSGGKTPREINIDPTGKWLLAANQDSDTIVVFVIDQKTGLLKKHSTNNEVASPSCIQF